MAGAGFDARAWLDPDAAVHHDAAEDAALLHHESNVLALELENKGTWSPDDQAMVTATSACFFLSNEVKGRTMCKDKNANF